MVPGPAETGGGAAPDGVPYTAPPRHLKPKEGRAVPAAARNPAPGPEQGLPDATMEVPDPHADAIRTPAASGGDWTRAASLATLEARGRLLFRKAGRQILLFDTPDGVRACNNRCPHEGYPLREGSLDERGVVTCNWHNWKFDLCSGENLYGGERLRTYPVEVRDGDVWIDLADPPFRERRAAILASLREACEDNAYERIARETARLHRLGADPLDALRDTIAWSAERMEFGWTHAYAGVADWLSLHDEREGDDETRLACLLEGVAHVADDVLREPRHPFPGGTRAYDEQAFVDAVEHEDEGAAIAMLRGGLAAGLRFPDLERGLCRAALAHYNDFGHSLIYVTKAGRLIERLGPGVAGPLLFSLARGMVFATREDLIPEFRSYAKALARWRGAKNGVAPSPADWRGLGIEKALARAADLSAAPPMRLFHALLGANARNLLTFDAGQQHRVRIPIDDNVGWLDFTHGLTFASAVRRQCGRFPELWPAALLQMACFSGRNAPYTNGETELDTWRIEDPEAFFERTIEGLFDHGVDEFIVSVHLLKTVLAAREELRAGPPAEVAELIAAGVNRFLHSPLKRKQVRRSVYQAMHFVARDG